MSLIEKIVKSNRDGVKGGLNTYVNPYSYMLLRKSGSYMEFENIYIDGISLVAILNFFFLDDFHRNSFDMTSMALDVFESGSRTGKSIALVGSSESEIEGAVYNIKRKFHDVNIVEYRSGYFSKGERGIYIDQLVAKNPSIVVVGMGTPLQEEFLLDLRAKGWGGEGYTCGGFFHQTAKDIIYYPRLVDFFNLRWAYRIYDEPKLMRRYFVDYPKAIVLIIKDILEFKFQ